MIKRCIILDPWLLWNLNLILLKQNYKLIQVHQTEAAGNDINSIRCWCILQNEYCMVLGAYTIKPEDDLDSGEEHTKSDVEV